MVTTHFLTIDDLLALDKSGSFELVEGELREVSPSSMRSSQIAGELFALLRAFVKPPELGWLTSSEGGYTLSRDPDTVVAPDVGYVSRSRLLHGVPHEGYCPVPPDLAVEVVSPSDDPGRIRQKQRLYELAKVPMTWWVDLKRQVVTVHRPGTESIVSGSDDVLDGGGVLPGLRLPVRAIFEF